MASQSQEQCHGLPFQASRRFFPEGFGDMGFRQQETVAKLTTFRCLFFYRIEFERIAMSQKRDTWLLFKS
jgi:hypothetical protein